MQLRYGTYQFEDNACKVTGGISEFVKNEGGQNISARQALEVSGYMTTSGQADTTLKMNALASALAQPYRDLVLYDDNGNETSSKLKGANSLTGVRIKDLTFPKCEGGTYSSYQYFTFRAEAEYPLTGSALMLVSFTETLMFEGGGPVYTFKLALNGPPQKQLVYPSSVYKARQAGELVGYLLRPAPPPPLWPLAWTNPPGRTEITTPNRKGGLRPFYANFRVTWEYEFQSAYPLVGIPNLWL